MEIFFCGATNPFRVLFLPLKFVVNYKFLNYVFNQKRNKKQLKLFTITLQYNFYQISNTEPLQDPENTCYIDSSCKPTGSVDNPFN